MHPVRGPWTTASRGRRIRVLPNYSGERRLADRVPSYRDYDLDLSSGCTAVLTLLERDAKVEVPAGFHTSK